MVDPGQMKYVMIPVYRHLPDLLGTLSSSCTGHVKGICCNFDKIDATAQQHEAVRISCRAFRVVYQDHLRGRLIICFEFVPELQALLCPKEFSSMLYFYCTCESRCQVVKLKSREWNGVVLFVRRGCKNFLTPLAACLK